LTLPAKKFRIKLKTLQETQAIIFKTEEFRIWKK